MKESQVNVVLPLITDSKPPFAVEPGDGAFNHPPMPAQFLIALYSFTCYAALDAPVSKKRPAPRYVIRLVSMPLVRTLTRPTSLVLRPPDRLNAVHHLFKDPRVMGVGTSQFYTEGYSFGFDHNMAFRARFALICGVRPNSRSLWVPFFTPLARTVSLSKLALDQSILSASPKRLRSARCRLRHTPAFCQSRNLRQQVTPLPQPISCGSISQGKPLR